MGNKKIFGGKMKKVGILIFILALTVGVIFANSFGFGRFNILKFGAIQGSGNSKIEQRNVVGFSKIEAGSAITIEISVQKDFSVAVEADDNLLANITTVVDGDTLKIYTKGKISTRNPINVRISMPEIEGLDVSGASKANVSNLQSESLRLETSGAAKVTLNGVVKTLNLDASGASKIVAENLTVENADLGVSGASNIVVFVSGQLNAEASGASKIVYLGNPTNISKRSSGASSVMAK